MLWMLTLSIVMALFGITVYVYYHMKGQFEDQEEAKYILFRDEELTENSKDK